MRGGTLPAARPDVLESAPTSQNRRRSGGRVQQYRVPPGSTIHPCKETHRHRVHTLPLAQVPTRVLRRAVPLADVLTPRAILVLVGRDVQLVTQESTGLHACQGWGHGVTPLWDEDNEGQRLRGLVQKLLAGRYSRV